MCFCNRQVAAVIREAWGPAASRFLTVVNAL